MRELTVPSRFNGPTRSGNGGWTAGALASFLTQDPAEAESHSPIQVTLRTPPPLDTAMTTRLTETALQLSHGDTLVAEAETIEAALHVPAAVELAEAQAASATHQAPTGAWFGSCFVCGADRTPGDGLRILAGRLENDRGVAAPWTPHPSTWSPGTPEDHASLACTWAALDCAGGWAGDLVNRPMLLGRMTAEVHALPRTGQPHVVVGELLRTDGRRSFTATALRDAEGRLLASAEHVWFAVDPSAFA